MEEYKIDDKIYEFKIDEAIFNELMKDYPPKELPKEVLDSLEDILNRLKKNFNNHESDKLRIEFVVGIALYSIDGYNTGMLWERYEMILKDLHKVDILRTR